MLGPPNLHNYVAHPWVTWAFTAALLVESCSMNFFVAVTDYDWFQFHASKSRVVEVNF